ncbi:MAG: hypothetical protein KatS3mg102_0898 [Planctomycetota bacterium]|nr:MAG: hypothetical protein KatS3mg102_0898 [Planctomycetota bacterium]
MDPEALSEVTLLRALPAPLRARIAPEVRRQHFPAGAIVVRRGDPASELFIVLQGRAEVLAPTPGEDGELVLAEIGPGGFFGEMGLLGGEPRSTTVRAGTALELAVVPATALAAIEQEDPVAALRLCRAMLLENVRRLRRTNEAVAAHFHELVRRLEHERLEGELLHLIVHDLRSPLAVCEAGLSQLLERADKYGPLTERQQRVLRRSRRSAIFVRQLVEEILELGRAEIREPRREWTTIAEILLEALPQCLARVEGPSLEEVADPSRIETVIAALAAQQIHIEADPATLEMPLLTDRLRMTQILLNLIGNALKYAPGWMAIRIARPAEGRMRIAVVDRGPGIPEEMRASIFERYRQHEAKRRGVPRGFGLGLAGAAQLVATLGGTIRAEPGDGGVGTRLVVEIPTHLPERTVPPGPPGAPAGG